MIDKEPLSTEDALALMADLLVKMGKAIDTNNERLVNLGELVKVLDQREENRHQLLTDKLDVIRDLMRDERHSMREFTAWLQLMAPTFPGFKSEPHSGAPKGIGLPDDPQP